MPLVCAPNQFERIELALNTMTLISPAALLVYIDCQRSVFASAVRLSLVAGAIFGALCVAIAVFYQPVAAFISLGAALLLVGLLSLGYCLYVRSAAGNHLARRRLTAGIDALPLALTEPYHCFIYYNPSYRVARLVLGSQLLSCIPDELVQPLNNAFTRQRQDMVEALLSAIEVIAMSTAGMSLLNPSGVNSCLVLSKN